MNFVNKLKQTISFKVLSLLGYIIFAYAFYWDVFYFVSTEEDLINKELNALFFGIYFYAVCTIIIILASLEILFKKSFIDNFKIEIIFKIGIFLHLTPIINIFVIFTIPFLKLLT